MNYNYFNLSCEWVNAFVALTDCRPFVATYFKSQETFNDDNCVRELIAVQLYGVRSPCARASRKQFTKLENVPSNQRQIGEPSEVRIISNRVGSSLHIFPDEQREAPL